MDTVATEKLLEMNRIEPHEELKAGPGEKWGFRFRVLGFGVWGLGFGDQDLGLVAYGLLHPKCRPLRIKRALLGYLWREGGLDAPIAQY